MPHFSVIGSLTNRTNVTSSVWKKFLLSNKQDVVCKKIIVFFQNVECDKIYLIMLNPYIV